jgi:hypothetical protein
VVSSYGLVAVGGVSMLDPSKVETRGRREPPWRGVVNTGRPRRRSGMHRAFHTVRADTAIVDATDDPRSSAAIGRTAERA